MASHVHVFSTQKNHINEQTRADLVSTKMFFLSEKKQYQQVLKKMRWRESQVSVGRGGWSGRSLTTAAAAAAAAPGASQRRRQGEAFASLSGNGDAAPNQPTRAPPHPPLRRELHRSRRRHAPPSPPTKSHSGQPDRSNRTATPHLSPPTRLNLPPPLTFI